VLSGKSRLPQLAALGTDLPDALRGHSADEPDQEQEQLDRDLVRREVGEHHSE
jgi:hypothetical protein